ncbi:hypothetical protein Tco_0586119 [Tanacetum coccineum]
MSNNTFSTKASCPGRQAKEEKKRSKHEDEPFFKDGGNNAEANGSASRKAEHVVGQDGSSGSGIGDVIGLPTADGAGGTSVGVGSQDRREMGDGIPT